MLSKIFRARGLLFLALLTVFTAPPARADDTGLFVHYECDTARNRVTVKTFVSARQPWEAGKDNLPFTWLTHAGRPLECSFTTGDSIFVKAYYGDGPAGDGEYQHVAIFINDVRMKHLLEFGPYESDSVSVTLGRNDRMNVSYSEK